MNKLTPEHLADIVRHLLDITNQYAKRHDEHARPITATLKIKLAFDKEAGRSEYRASGAVDIPDGELDSEIKRTDAAFLCTLHSGIKGQQKIEAGEE